jgi:hypothetical protein
MISLGRMLGKGVTAIAMSHLKRVLSTGLFTGRYKRYYYMEICRRMR